MAALVFCTEATDFAKDMKKEAVTYLQNLLHLLCLCQVTEATRVLSSVAATDNRLGKTLRRRAFAYAGDFSWIENIVDGDKRRRWVLRDLRACSPPKELTLGTEGRMLTHFRSESVQLRSCREDPIFDWKRLLLSDHHFWRKGRGRR